MTRKKGRPDGIYIDDSEMSELIDLCHQRNLFEAEQRTLLANERARAAEERAKKAERDREIAFSCAIQAEQKAMQDIDNANFSAFRAQQETQRVNLMKSQQASVELRRQHQQQWFLSTQLRK